MDSNKKECVKNINLCLEKVLENFIEITDHLRIQKSTRLDEMKSLVFAKKRASELSENLGRILQNLIQLKLIYRNFNLNYKSSQPERGFDNLFKKLNSDFTFHNKSATNGL